MIQYVLINLILSCCALSINHLMHIPHRIRFYILMVAVTAWVIPFSFITIELTQQIIPVLPIQSLQIDEQQLAINTSSKLVWDVTPIFCVMALMGLIKFIYDLYITSKLVQRLKTQSKPYKNQHNIRLSQTINGAFVSGYFKPIIWIDEQLEQTETLRTVMAHERQHIRANDQFWLLIITFIQRLLWFNPITYLICQKARYSIELSCDEACKLKLGLRHYQTHLAQLILLHKAPNPITLNNQVSPKSNFNIYRIKQLNQENTMYIKQKIKLAALSVITSFMCVYSLLSYATTDTSADLKPGQVLSELNITIGEAKTENISLIINEGETAEIKFDSYHLHIKPKRIFDEENAVDAPILLITELTIKQTSNDQTQTVLANPVLMLENNKWGELKITQDKSTENIALKLRTTVID